MSGLITKILNDSIRYTPQQKFAELTPFLEFIIKDTNCNNALEIGTGNGGLTYILSTLFDKVVTIDIMNEVQYEKDNIIRLIANSHNLSSQEWEKIVQFYPYDLIFIDGDHSYEGVKQDFEIYSPLLAFGGIVAFHDIKDTELQRQNNCFVSKFVKEVEQANLHISTKVFNDFNDEWSGRFDPAFKNGGGIQMFKFV